MRALFACGIAIGTAIASMAVSSAQPVAAQRFPFKSGPVTITACSLGQSGNNVASNSLEIKYFQNVPGRHLVSITFRVRYAGETANVADTGTFSYNAEIDHHFNALAGVPWAGSDPSVCRVLSATFGDGETVRPEFAEYAGDKNDAGAPSAGALAPATPQQFPLRAGPVTITSCSLGANGNVVADNSLEIKYFQNVPRRHLSSVTFRVRYAGQTVTFTDSGTFSYDAPIDHTFNQLGGLPYGGPNPDVCRVSSATFGDGQTVTPPYSGDDAP